MPLNLVAGRYELRELLGEGGMGFVYRAVDTRTGGLVAIKTMRDMSDPRSLEMFKKEWGVLARLSHPNIIDIRDVAEIEEDGKRKPCFIMPLLQGVTLGKLIKDGSARLSVQRLVGMLCQVCNGLEAAHRNNIIHRDLKPTNIFIMEDDTAKIIDFGLVHSADAKSVTGYKGTWQYMAPEQTEGKSPTPLSDIFALGIVAYESFTGRKPFARPSVEATVDAIRTYIPPTISEINPKVSQLLSKVIHKSMAKQPMHRYASAKEFGDTLQNALHNVPIERFDSAKIQPRIERARKAFTRDDTAFASEILTELEAEGTVDPEITLLRAQIEESVKQKKIRSLFEAAQTRVEQDEIPLALDKLREILSLDPENADALAMRKRIEQQRSNQQISNWMKLARQHLELHDFHEARQALKEVLNLRYDDSDALQLLSAVDVEEKEAAKARLEKEQLYGSALKAYQGGEISTALSRLEKILEVSRRTPGATVPEREAVYQSFYNRVQSERDSIDKGYEEGRRFLNEKDFKKALEICDQMLATYPSSAQFQALKLKVEQAARQELSAYIAEIGRSVDSEPDLNRRVNILEMAGKRYPGEGQFEQSLRLAREQRDLVNSISAKARQYEEQSQFADAIGQWRILRSIHPQYPGIDFEIGQLEKRREQQSGDEKKARFVEQIDRAIGNGAFAKAVEAVAKALEEFPQDPELIVLEKIARQGLDRIQEAEQLFENARELRVARRYEEAIDLFQRALKLDERNLGIRNALVSLYVERAHAFLDEDWRKSEPLAQAASELDDQHPAVKRLGTLIAESKRKDLVAQCVADTRKLQVSGDVPGALTRLNDGLSVCPGEPRLLQYKATLESSLEQQKETKTERPADVRENVPLKKAAAAMAGAADIDASKKDGLTALFQRSEFIPNSLVASAPQSAPASRPIADDVIPSPAELPKATQNTTRLDWRKKLHILNLEVLLKPKKLSFWLYAIAAFGVLCVAGIVLTRTHKQILITGRQNHRALGVAAKPVIVNISTTPTDATVMIDSSVQSDRSLTLDSRKTYDVTISRPGYKSLREQRLSPNSPWSFILEPEPLHIQVLTAERSGRISLDGKEIWNLQQGDLMNFEVAADSGRHTLSARNKTGELFRAEFDARTATIPQVKPFDTPDLIVASSFENEATVYSGSSPKSLSLPNRAAQPIAKTGTSLDLAGTDPDQTVLVISDSRGHQSFPLVHGNTPTLCVSLNANPNLGFLTVTSSVENAHLFFDGKERKTRKPGTWRLSGVAGAHEVRLVADGFADESQTVQLQRGQEISQEIDLHPAKAELAIEGGTAGAQVVVDDTVSGTLDAGGNARTSVSPGLHQVEIRKDGFESITLRRAFTAGQALKLQGKEAALRAFGTMTFEVTPQNAAVEYRRIDDQESHPGMTSGSAKVKAGTYEVTAHAYQYETETRTILITPGEARKVEVRLNRKMAILPLPPTRGKELFQHPDQVQEGQGKWLTGATPGFAQLRPGSRYTLTFLKPERVPLKHKSKRFEWHVSLYPDAELDYELDAQQLNRKAKAGGKTAKSGAKVDTSDGDSIYSVVVTLEAHQVQIKRKDGTLLDDYADSQHDWSRAIIGIRGDQFFTVSKPF